MSLSSGLALYRFIYVAAPAVSGFFESTQLTSILRVLRLAFVVNALKTIPYNRWTKDLFFDKRSEADFASIISGSIGSISLAWLGFGAWSLVFGPLIQSVVLAILVFCFSHWRPRPVVRLRRIRRILDFGIPVLGARVLWCVYSSADFFVVAKFLGERWLGYYTIAFGLAASPVQKIIGTMNQIGFPVFSKLQSDSRLFDERSSR